MNDSEKKQDKKGITLLAVLAILSTPVTVPLFIAMLAVLAGCCNLRSLRDHL